MAAGGAGLKAGFDGNSRLDAVAEKAAVVRLCFPPKANCLISVMDVVDRLPHTEENICRKQQLKDRLIEHKHFIAGHAEGMAQVREWKWLALSR